MEKGDKGHIVTIKIYAIEGGQIFAHCVYLTVASMFGHHAFSDKFSHQ